MDDNNVDDKKILVVDDSVHIRGILESMLHNAGYTPLMASTGHGGLQLFHANNPDLIILDISMPGMDGWEVCEQIRETSNVPVIFLTAAYVTIPDKIRGLDLGANDYIIKPFHQQEFLARIRANLRISPILQSRHEYSDSYLNINFLEHSISCAGKAVDLTEKEFALLRILVQSADSIVDNETLYDKVWGYPDSFDANYVRIYMSSLRRKIEPNGKKPTYILTERGIGYRFVSQGDKLPGQNGSDSL